MEKVQLILQLLHPYTFIPTSTVIREMRVYTRVQRLCSRITTGRMSHIIFKEFAGKGGNNSIDLNRGGTEVGSLSIFFSLDKDVLQEEDQANEFSAFTSSKALKNGH